MTNFFKRLFGGGRDKSLDNDLVARIADELKIEPSEQLREMLAQAAGDKWSAEALKAACLLLEQRSNQLAPEPVYRTVPRAEQGQCSREWKIEDAVLAPGYSGLSRTGVLSPGRIGEIKDKTTYIYFYNGERGWVRLEDVQPFAIDVGSRIYSRWRNESGTIIRWQDEEERFYIRFDNGEGEWATLGMFK